MELHIEKMVLGVWAVHFQKFEALDSDDKVRAQRRKEEEEGNNGT